MSRLLQRLALGGGDESGQTLVEYGLILSLIGVAAVVGLTALSSEVTGLLHVLETISDALTGG